MKAQRCVLDNSGSGQITSKGELLYLKACKSIGKGSSGHCHHQEDPYLLPSNFHQQTNELIERSSSALARFAGAVAVLNSLRRLSFAARNQKRIRVSQSSQSVRSGLHNSSSLPAQLLPAQVATAAGYNSPQDSPGPLFH